MAKNQYTVSMEDDRLVSVEINGTVYTDPDLIPDPLDRDKIQRLIEKTRDSKLDLDSPVSKIGDPTRILFGIFLGVAVILLAVAGFSTYRVLGRLAGEASAQGTVVRLAVYTDSGGYEYYYPVVAFNVPGQGVMTVEMPEGSRPAAYQVGQVVSLRYEAAQPEQARIQSLTGLLDLWFVPLVTGFLGVAFLGATALARWLGVETAPAQAELAKL